ncbi:unnamed protein product [Arabis nemorensis]|uniref:Uncharacterized protein n=1 Tax=Arabis nemorensis TaxID=586526 RepID=A0A565BU88_9BRAS|nr:unnamed protein product [Arabis nemorensis]
MSLSCGIRATSCKGCVALCLKLRIHHFWFLSYDVEFRGRNSNSKVNKKMLESIEAVIKRMIDEKLGVLQLNRVATKPVSRQPIEQVIIAKSYKIMKSLTVAPQQKSILRRNCWSF